MYLPAFGMIEGVQEFLFFHFNWFLIHFGLFYFIITC